MHSAPASRRAWPLLLALLAALQISFYLRFYETRPALGIVPPVPSSASVQALSLGDEQCYFRILALTLQNMGDTFGRFTSLKAYDYAKLAEWMNLLDTLDQRSNMVPAMAAYYYSATPNDPDTRHMANYLLAHASRDVGHKWWWLIQALYIAMHKLGDMDLALAISKPLLDPNVPAWAQQMAAVVREKRGEMEDALRIMEAIEKNAKNLTDADIKYMRYFIEERIHKLDAYERRKTGKP